MGALSGDLGSRAGSCGKPRKETPAPISSPAPSSSKNRRQTVPLPCLSPHIWALPQHGGSLCSEGAGSFPGSNILALVTQVSLHLCSSVDALLERDR